MASLVPRLGRGTQSVGLLAAWREALPWLVAAGTVCQIWERCRSDTRAETLGDVCLALRIGWSLPEVIDKLDATVTIPRPPLLSSLPLLRCRRLSRSAGVM